MPASRFAKRLIPSPEKLRTTPGLKWLGNYLETRPWLWVAHRRRVALGAALGVGFGVFPIPSQMLVAGAAAVVCRANVGAAVAATWLTNPFTLVPIWSLALFLGNLALPASVEMNVGSLPSMDWSTPQAWWDALTSLGKPFLVGLPLAGLVLGVATYALVYLAWWWVIRTERNRRLKRRT